MNAGWRQEPNPHLFGWTLQGGEKPGTGLANTCSRVCFLFGILNNWVSEQSTKF